MYDAIAERLLYRLALIGEAARRLSDPNSARIIPRCRWSAMAGLRDVLVHAYERIDLPQIWGIAAKSVPTVLAYIEPLLPTEDA